MDRSHALEVSSWFSFAVFQAVPAGLLSSGPFSWTVGLVPCILTILGLEDGLLAHPSSPF